MNPEKVFVCFLISMLGVFIEMMFYAFDYVPGMIVGATMVLIPQFYIAVFFVREVIKMRS